MHPSGSFILNTAQLIQTMVNEPVATGYDNSKLLMCFIQPAYADVLNDVRLSSQTPVVCDFTVPITPNQFEYAVPPNILEVYGLLCLSSTGLIIQEYSSGAEGLESGATYRIYGGYLRFTAETLPPAPQSGSSFVLRYAPSGEAAMHYGTGTLTTSTTCTLAATPTHGTLDLRPNAYVGQFIRFVNNGLRIWQERQITAYNPHTRVVTFSPAIDTTSGTGLSTGQPYVYEIAPSCDGPLWQAVAMKAAALCAVSTNAAAAVRQGIDIAYMRAKKTIMDKVSAFMPTPQSFKHHTRDILSNENARF